MVALPANPAATRLTPWLGDSPAAAILRRGGRILRGNGPGADRLVTLPEVLGPVCVLTPRGWGWPMLARRTPAGFRALAHGEPCAPERWSVSGGAAAWMRRCVYPRGPVNAEVRSPRPVGERGGWLHLRVADLAWAARRRIAPTHGHGPVVLGARTVESLSPEARARGLHRGMPLAVARRRCPGLQVVSAPEAHGEGAALAVEIGAWLEAEVGMTERVRGGWRVRWPSARGSAGLESAERLLRRLWQAFGVEGRAAVAGSAEAAQELVRILAPGWVAAGEAQADHAWAGAAPGRARWATGSTKSEWAGAPLVDVESVVAHARALSVSLAQAAEGGAITVRVQGERGEVQALAGVPRAAGASFAPSAVETAVRNVLLQVGAVHGLRLQAVTRRTLGGSRGAAVGELLPQAERAIRSGAR
jgi:hypothetical protein